MQSPQVFSKQSLMEVDMLLECFPSWPDALFEDIKGFILRVCAPTIKLPRYCRITLQSSFTLRTGGFVGSGSTISYTFLLDFDNNKIEVQEWKKFTHDVFVYYGNKGTMEVTEEHSMSEPTQETMEFQKFRLKKLLENFQAGLELCDDIITEEERKQEPDYRRGKQRAWGLEKARDGVLCAINKTISKQIRIQGNREIIAVTINQDGLPTSCIFGLKCPSRQTRYPEYEEFKINVM